MRKLGIVLVHVEGDQRLKRADGIETGNYIPAELEAARISERKSRMETNRNMSCKTCEPLTSITG